MSEWWTYRLSDFLLFSPRTYYRLFELYNAEVWPLQFVALALGAALVILSVRREAWAARAMCVGLAACWLWVAWAFHWQRFVSINWAATWYAGAFAIQAALLLGCAALKLPSHPAPRRLQFIGWGLLLVALAGQPWLAVLLGRPFGQAEVFGLMPDPTAVATLGLLLLTPRRSLGWLLWPIPVLWCWVSGATLWALNAPEAWLLPALATLALVAAFSPRLAARWAAR
ncbi:MAG: hypothetical protein H7Z15_13445 [Rhizobacter sp.]|nr:hypothetical protein [Rhizobacter sp.]